LSEAAINRRLRQILFQPALSVLPTLLLCRAGRYHDRFEFGMQIAELKEKDMRGQTE
jgi:hypothetical protein